MAEQNNSRLPLSLFKPASFALLCSVLVLSASSISAQRPANIKRPVLSRTVLIRIIKAEDERRWDTDLQSLFSDPNPTVRVRAALAAGRIGDERAIVPLAKLLADDKVIEVRTMAAFAIGEVESMAGAESLIAVLKNTGDASPVRARAIEGLGKIAAALPKDQEARMRELGTIIVDTLRAEAVNRELILFGLTAVLRSRPANAGVVVGSFLRNRDPRIRADAGNTLARLRAKDANPELRDLLKTDPDPVVRSNAARVLGATEDKESFDLIVDRAATDVDVRVRVSAIRALAALKDSRAVDPLLKRGNALTERGFQPLSNELNEVLEIATTLGRLLQLKTEPSAISWLTTVREGLGNSAPEVEQAFVRIAPDAYLASFGTGATAKRKVQETMLLNWRAASAIAQALREIPALPDSAKDKGALSASAEALLRAMLDYRNSGIKINTLVAVHSEYAVPDVMRSLAAFKPADLADVVRPFLNESDVVIRGTAADLLGDLPPSDASTKALIAALPVASKDSLTDALFSILDALGNQKNAAAIEAIKTSLDSRDQLVRRKAVAVLKAAGAGDFTAKIGIVQTANSDADYLRVISRMGRPVRAVVTTSKGSFTMELLPDDAPLSVDNFVKLANKGYFRNIVFHRVVPNFVIQGGDPRGDGNGGPGYQIRCEINEVPYDRGAVGMALSGKDTGGSQWFVTHAPQPHLDGGYTVFGRVISGMDVVDRIVRGDVIQSITIRSK